MAGGRDKRWLRRERWWLAAAAAPLALSLAAPDAVADQNTTDRSALVDEYLSDSRDRPPLYQGAPVTHIVPAFNTVTYALDARMLDTTVDPVDQRYPPKESLRVSGYTVAPYVALSLKRIGLGFNVEAGRKRIDYERDEYNGSTTTQESQLDERGLGVYGFFKLADSKVFSPTVILGAKSLSARHEVGASRSSLSSYDDTKSYQYNLNGYEAGFNAPLTLVKSFTIIPWLDYARIDTTPATRLADDRDQMASALLKEDIDVFWASEPNFNYGIDFAIRFDRFEVHIGGLLGLVVSSGAKNEDIEDNSYSISFAFDHKG